MSFNIKDIRTDFPILDQQVNNRPWVYFDNAATTQRPIPVVEKIQEFSCGPMPTFIVAPIPMPSKQRRLTKMPAILSGSFSMRMGAKRSSSPMERPNQSIWWPTLFVRNIYPKETRLLSPRWSIMPTSYPGRWPVKDTKQSSKFCHSRKTVN